MSKSQFHLLVIDDDELIAQSIQVALPKQWQLSSAKNLKDIEKISYDAAFIDMHLSGQINRCEGIDAIQKLREVDCHLEIVAMSGDLNRQTMEAALKAGASRFLAKPLTSDELRITLEKIEALLLLQRAQTRLSYQSPKWIGNSENSLLLQKEIAHLRGESEPVLIEGPSGTGKEVVAQLIHFQEGENRPFVSVNVAAITENLFESEMFGHVKGGFTGADNNKMGLLEAAHGGDLFLDEIEALPLSQQAKLLRFLESGEIRRVGDKKNYHIDVRIIAASNRPLTEMTANGEFREDLMWRLNGKKITLPPLSERREDIPELANYFLNLQKPFRNKAFDRDAIETLKNYNWPGNVRELKRVCEQLVITSPLPFIRREDVTRQIGRKTVTPSQAHSLDLTRGLSDLMNEFEATIIKKGLEKQQDIDATAKLLKISRSNLYKKIKDYRIEL